MLDLRYIGSLKLVYRVILLAILGIVVTVWVYYMLIAPEIYQTLQLQQTNLQLKQQYKLLVAQQYNNIAQLKNFTIIKRKFSVVARRIAAKDSVNQIIAGITRYAKVNKLDCCAVQPLEVIMQDCYNILPVKFILRGGYHNVGKLLAYITNVKQIAVVHSLNVSVTSKDLGKDLTTIELLLYVYTKK